MDDKELPEGYRITYAGGHYTASKMHDGVLRYALLNKKGEIKYWLSREKAAAYCQKHAAKGLSYREEAK